MKLNRYFLFSFPYKLDFLHLLTRRSLIRGALLYKPNLTSRGEMNIIKDCHHVDEDKLERVLLHKQEEEQPGKQFAL